MSLIAGALLVQTRVPCWHVADLAQRLKKGIPLPQGCTLRPFTAMGEPGCPVTVQTGWSTAGLGVVLEVTGKAKGTEGDASRPHLADGVSLWINTRGGLSGKRANAYCHLLHLLPVGGGADKTEPVLCLGKIPRALEEAPAIPISKIFFRSRLEKGGYTLAALIPQEALHGFDIEQNRTLAFQIKVKDAERGAMVTCADLEVNFEEDPSWWDRLILRDEPPPGEPGSITDPATQAKKAKSQVDSFDDEPPAKPVRRGRRKAGENG